MRNSDWITPSRRTKVTRVGVVPFFIDENNELSFLMGLDYHSGELTDFGGGRKKGERSLRCARREFAEETNSLFSVRGKSFRFSIRNHSTLIYFVRFSIWEIQRGVSQFRPLAIKPEIRSLVCLPVSRLQKVLTVDRPYRVYHRIVMLIKRAIAPSFASLLFTDCFTRHSQWVRYPHRYIKDYEFLSSPGSPLVPGRTRR